MTLPIYSDTEIGSAISENAVLGHHILVLANGYTAVLGVRDSAASPWTGVARGDFGLNAAKAAKEAISIGLLWWLDVDGFPSDADLAAVSPWKASIAGIDNWLTTAESLTTVSGRESGASQSQLDELGDLAAWRCQFSGCGKDLIRHGATGSRNKSSYFAHIIAASPKGPRGDPLLSSVKARDVTNYLLLCDECHRLIDKKDPKRFTVPILQKMRETSLEVVRRVLDSLRYPEAVQVVLMGNVTGQASQFVAREAEEAMWERGLRTHHSLPPQYFFENRWTQHDPISADYWSALFAEIAGELPLVRRFLQSHGESGKDRLAVFPVHGISILVLAGRIFGEAAAVHLFQFRREQPADQVGGRWHLEDSNYDAENKFTCEVLQPHIQGAKEACLIIGLTYDVAPTRLTHSVFNDGEFKLPTLQISSIETRHQDIVRSEADLINVSRILGVAIQTLQDQWRVEKVHLFIGAPATACFMLGQKLQARNHAVYLCHETLPGANNPFFPTIKIENSQVVAVTSGQQLKIG